MRPFDEYHPARLNRAGMELALQARWRMAYRLLTAHREIAFGAVVALGVAVNVATYEAGLDRVPVVAILLSVATFLVADVLICWCA